MAFEPHHSVSRRIRVWAVAVLLERQAERDARLLEEVEELLDLEW